MTHKLFHDDVNIRQFDADVLRCEPFEGDAAQYGTDEKLYCVWLDRTAFYAEAGGQPCDKGVLGGAAVMDVQVGKDKDLYHVVNAPLMGRVHGEIDWPRRFSNMQQHGGQHLLSWAIHNRLGGYTYGLHIGAQECTIDTDLKEAPARAVLDQLESDVNNLIWRDLPVRQWFPTDEEMRTLPLRKKPTVSENIRIVMTGDVECVACCGTHPNSSGQIGILTILGAHPARGKTRFEFLCGGRAYARLKAEAEACRAAGLLLSATHENLAQATRHMLDYAQTQAHALALFRQEELLRALPALRERAAEVKGVKLIAHRFAAADRDSLLKAASALITASGTVALLAAGTDGSQGDIVVFGRADDVDCDMGKLMRAALKPFGGRGGGKPNFAQGGAPVQLDAAALTKAFEAFGG